MKKTSPSTSQQKSVAILTGRAKGPSGRLLSSVSVKYEVTRSMSTPPGWNTSPLQVTSQHFVGLRLSPKQFAGAHLYTWVHTEQGTVGAPARAQTLNIQVRWINLKIIRLDIKRNVKKIYNFEQLPPQTVCHLSAGNLSTVCLKVFGKSVGQLLANSLLSISEVSGCPLVPS